ncbi:MAG: VWA domain-containing protein [Lachnospiraceae bacterium]|nr:VWA domain-containing protein [Lachnospiraceae bacterium]
MAINKSKKILCAVSIVLVLCSMAGISSRAEEAVMAKEDLNIVFAVDHSGSMNEQDAQRMISQVLQIFTDTMHGENVRIGYLAYNDTIIAQNAPVPVQQESRREALKETINSTVNKGETDIGLGLREAYHLMDGCTGRKMVVLISDGETDLERSDTGRTEQDSEQDIEETVSLCKEEGTPIITVAFGREYEGEESELRAISEQTGGESYEADKPEELLSILYDLFHTDFSYSVREISDSIYDGGSQRINCGVGDTAYDELSVLLFSDREIRSAVIVRNGNETQPRIMRNYAVAEFLNAGEDEELTVEFETEQKQRVSVFLIGRRNIMPVIKWNDGIYKNREAEFEICFQDESGRWVESPIAYDTLRWQADFRNIEEDISIPVELETTQTGLQGHVTFGSSGRYRLYLNTGRNSESTYEISEIHVLNTLPDSKDMNRIEMHTLTGELMFDLTEYFADADGDALSFELQELPQEVVSASVEGHYLHINPQGRGTGDIVLLVSDGEGSLMGRLTVRVRSWMEIYPAVPLLVICLLLFALFKIYRRKKKVVIVPETVEEKNRCYFTGRINVYFTLLPNGMEEIPPLTFTLHPIREGRIVVGDMLKNYAELSALLELDRMFLYPADNRKIIFYHNSRASVMVGNSIVCRRMQYALAYGSVIYATSQDGECEMEMHYVSAN